MPQKTSRQDKARRSSAQADPPPLPLHLPGFLFMQIVRLRQDTAAGSPTEARCEIDRSLLLVKLLLSLLNLTRRDKQQLPTHPMDKPFPASHLTLHRSQASLTGCQLSSPPHTSAARAGLPVEDHQVCFFLFLYSLHYPLLYPR